MFHLGITTSTTSAFQRRFRRLASLVVACIGAMMNPFLMAQPTSTEPKATAVAETNLWSHLHSVADLKELRDMTAEWSQNGEQATLTLHAQKSRYAWGVIPPPEGGWDLARREAVEATITNRTARPVEVMLWVVSDRGWDAVPDVVTLQPDASQVLRCDLREKFPDGTPKIDPSQIKQIQIMLPRLPHEATIEVRGLVATGQQSLWHRPVERLVLPPIEESNPAAGRRVRYRLAGDEGWNLYSVLMLPTDWKAGQSYPILVEYPGNVFFVRGCYSTGLPDQCTIGYGMTRGEKSIWLSLPFVDRTHGGIAEHGWGNPDETVDYALRVIEEVMQKFGGDRNNIVLTGFSRGAIACGYIGLRDERIAALWKGFHACQHYDGDGWNGAVMDEALVRARRFRGLSVFQTDNSREKFQPLMEAMQAESVFVSSNLGAHACAMFLDDRPSTQQLREWYADLTVKPWPVDGKRSRD